MIKNGVRLSPPPGCPRAIYKLIIQCWLVYYYLFKFTLDKNYKLLYLNRHPETSGRPIFTNLVFRLSQPENQLLQWMNTIGTHDPQSTMLGAPLETASNLHSDLQQQYFDDQQA